MGRIKWSSRCHPPPIPSLKRLADASPDPRPEAKKQASDPSKPDAALFNKILDGLRAVVTKIDLSQSTRNGLKTFIYHDFGMSYEMKLSRFTPIFLQGFEVDQDDLKSLDLSAAFDKVFKTDSFGFEPTTAIMYAMMTQSLLDISRLRLDQIREDPLGFRALLTGIASLLDHLDDSLSWEDWNLVVVLILSAEGKEWWSANCWQAEVLDRFDSLLAEVDKMVKVKPKAKVKAETS